MIEAGKVLQQRYRIDKLIGQGGMGAVYVAMDERFGSTVAIKQTLFMDDNYRKAIDREARLLNSLKHVALPRVSDHFLEENGQFLVMEYIPGEDMGHMIEAGDEPFPVDKVLTWADQLLDALDFLHNQTIPVIHRDIKPQNLKLTSRGQIILLDFGLAKGNPTDAGHQTAAKSIFGYSRNYASLEQIQGTGTDPRSDLYSLAATLYHLLTGVPPDDALTRAMSVLSNKPDPLQPANAIRPAIPAGVAGVLQMALDLNADERPETATAMRQMFRENEQYSERAVASVIGRRTDTDLLAQKTRLMPGVTHQESGGQTDIKTEILPGIISEETSVRSASAGTAARLSGAYSTSGVAPAKRTGVLKTASALAVVLLIAGSAVGLYFFNPSFMNLRSDAPSAVEPVSEPAPAANAASMPDTAETEAAANSSSANAISTTAEKTKVSPVTSKTPLAAKSAKSTDENAADADDDPGDIRVDGEDVYIGNIKVNDKGIRPNTYVDKNGVRRRIPTPPGSMPFPGLTREQIRNMTPEQRRKLAEAQRKLLMLQKPEAPTPDQ